MHEVGLVRDLLERATEVASEEDGELASIQVRIGKLSSIDPNFFRDQISLLAPDVELVIDAGDGQEVNLVSVRVR